MRAAVFALVIAFPAAAVAAPQAKLDRNPNLTPPPLSVVVGPDGRISKDELERALKERGAVVSSGGTINLLFHDTDPPPIVHREPARPEAPVLALDPRTPPEPGVGGFQLLQVKGETVSAPPDTQK